MGMYQNLHFGYYVIGEERTIEATETVDVCERDESHELADGGFCPVCGGTVISVEKPYTTTVSLWDYEELVDQFNFPEYVSPDGKSVGISNYGAGRINLEEGDFVDFDDLKEIQEKLYQEFIERHEKDIALLKEHVFDNVEVKFGMFYYYT